MKTPEEAIAIINKHLGMMGRLISNSKYDYEKRNPDNIVVFNANVFADGYMPNKLWWGDIDITEDSQKLSLAAQEIGATLYILKEMDGRFTNELQPNYKEKAIWSTKD